MTNLQKKWLVIWMADMKEKLIELLNQGAGNTPCDSDCWDKKCNDCIREAQANHLIANGVTVQEWISVKDRLPENREDVLVVAFWHERWNVQWGWYAPNGRVWHVGLMEETDYPVSHWMPLPEPPKGE